MYLQFVLAVDCLQPHVLLRQRKYLLHSFVELLFL